MTFGATAERTPLARRRRRWVADSCSAAPRASGDALRTQRGVGGASSTHRDGQWRHGLWGVTAVTDSADGTSVGSGSSGAAVTAHNTARCISCVRCQQIPLEQRRARGCAKRDPERGDAREQ